MEDSEFIEKAPRPKTKVCKRCGKEKPANARFFLMSRKTGDGLKDVCRHCYNAQRNATLAKKGLPPEPKKVELNLSSISDDILVTELKKRGFKGSISYTIIHEL